jgi:glycerol-3-phosphate dehydrogenase
VVSAERTDDHWTIETKDIESGERRLHRARVLVNAGGPWAGEIIRSELHINSPERIRLVRGSHIVTRRLFDHGKCYFFQGTDGRIIFAIPYETDFTLIGTTDADHPDPSVKPVCTEEEQDYLIAFANRYLRHKISREDIVWTYSGVRPLYDDGASSATAATRDYTLKLDEAGGAPLLNVFGGKITTYRRLAEGAVEKIARFFPGLPGPWTKGVALPGGDFPVDGVPALVARLREAHPFLTEAWALRLVRAYGTEAAGMLSGARLASDLGRDFGATLTAREVDWLMSKEYARTAQDILWRRTKLGLRLSAEEAGALDAWMAGRRTAAPAAAE